MRAVSVESHGGPGVYRVTQLDLPKPGPGQLLVKVSVSGVNYLDVYQRLGNTPLKAPFVAGVEGVGVVVDGDNDVAHPNGQRVGWLSGGQGSFADYALVASDNVVSLPDDVDDETAVALLMQGITAHYLINDAAVVQPGDPVLVHAAAGGVGQLLTQAARLHGAVVIATTSSVEKADLARAAGAHHVVGYEDFVEEVDRITGGEGVAAAYDGVGRRTVPGSLASVRVRGTLVVYGAASGPPPPIELHSLAARSVFATRPSVVHYTRTPDELRARASAVFDWVRDKDVSVNIGARYALEDVADAFTALESRRTFGKVLLTH